MQACCRSDHPQRGCTPIAIVHNKANSKWVSGPAPTRKAASETASRECPRPESNQRTRFRKPLLYPLSYGGLWAWLSQNWLNVIYPLYPCFARRSCAPRCPSQAPSKACKSPGAVQAAANVSIADGRTQHREVLRQSRWGAALNSLGRLPRSPQVSARIQPAESCRVTVP